LKNHLWGSVMMTSSHWPVNILTRSLPSWQLSWH
jgi:hypothetical protein